MVSLCQLNLRVGDILGNQNQIIDSIHSAQNQGAWLIVFSELTICGYPPKDLLLYSDFVSKCMQAIHDIAQKVDEKTHVIVGGPFRDENFCYNTLFVLHNKQIIHTYHKQLLPTYNIFDEARYFEPGKSPLVLNIKGYQFAFTICEDLWNGIDRTYDHTPLDLFKAQKIDYVVNISASPFNTDHQHHREDVLKRNCIQYNTGIIYVNQVGANTDLVFDGGSMFFDALGNKRVQCAYFQPEIKTFSLKDVPSESITTINTLESIENALVLGIQDYFAKNGFKKAILGLSGGIDSALVLYLAQKALGKEHVLPVLMPSMYSSISSVDDSVALCRNLEMPFLKIPIHKAHDTILSELHPFFEEKTADVTEENIQARIRGLYLMALANKHHCVLLNTTNKSEAAVGYGTLYGDLCGGLSVLGDVYKTQVYALAQWINKDLEIIPNSILCKAPSAELRPDQKDTDSLPAYEWLDQVLFDYIEEYRSIDHLILKHGNEKDVKKIIQLVLKNEYKRFQMAPVIRVSKRAFGDGRNMPLTFKYAF